MNQFPPKSSNAHPSILFNFHEVGCLDFCQRVQEVKSFSPLTHLCTLRFKDKHFQLAGLNFNRDLELQRTMMRHHKKLNQFAHHKLKTAQEKIKEAKGKRLARKVKKDTSGLHILASASKHIAKNS